MSLKWKILLWEVCGRGDDDARECERGKLPLCWSEWYKCENKVAVFAKALVQDPEKSKQLGGQTWTCTLVSVG